MCLIKSSCTFVTSDFPAENPRTQNRTILIRDRWQQAEKIPEKLCQ